MRINIPVDKSELIGKRERQHSEYIKSYKKQIEQINNLEKTGVKQVYTRLNHQVELALKAAEDSLENKRNILRKKYLEDESCLITEYVDKAQKYAEQLNEEKRQKAEEILARQEKEREQYVNNIYEQLKVANCDVLRAKSSRENRKMLQNAHKLQILEKQQLKEEQEKIDLMYRDIYQSNKICDKDEMRNRKQYMDRLQMDDFLRKQMLARKLADDEMKMLKQEEKECLEKLVKTLDEEKTLETQRNYKRKEKLRKILVNQIEVNNDIKQRRKSWDDEMDRIFLENLQKESEEVKLLEFQQKKRTAQELRNYAKVWAEFNEFNNELKTKENQRLNDIKMEKLDNIHVSKVNEEQARRKLAQDTVSYWNEQVLEKLERKKCEKEISSAERQLHDSFDVDLDKARTLRKLEYDRSVQSDIKQQIEYRKLMNQREKDKRLEQELNLIDEENKNYEYCLSKDIRESRKLHPFYSQLFPEN